MKIFNHFITNNLLLICLITFSQLSYKVQATCDQELTNNINHPHYGKLSMVKVDHNTNGAGWDKQVQDIPFGEKSQYSVTHRKKLFFLADDEGLEMTVKYRLKTVDNYDIAEIEMYTTCYSQKHKTVNHLSCKPLGDTDDTFCFAVGLSQVTCSERLRRNNQIFSAQVVADNSGVQKNDFLCNEENSFSVLRRIDFVFGTQYGQVQRDFMGKESLLDTSVMAKLVEEGKQKLQDAEQNIEVHSQDLTKTKQLIDLENSRFRSQNRTDYDSVEYAQHKSKVQNLVLKLQDQARVIQGDTIELRKSINRMKNNQQTYQALVVLHHAKDMMYTFKTIMGAVKKLVDSSVNFLKTQMCSIIYYTSLGAGLLLDLAAKSLPGVGGALTTLAKQSYCLLFYEETRIITMETKFGFLLPSLINNIHKLANVFPTVLRIALINLTVKSGFATVMLNFIWNLACGSPVSALITLAIVPLLCPQTIYGKQCGLELGPAVCPVEAAEVASKETQAYIANGNKQKLAIN
eukprot:Pgem_evm1s18831